MGSEEARIGHWMSSIYTGVDLLMQEGHFEFLNSILNEEPAIYNVDLALAWITATLPAKDKLPYRRMYIKVFRETYEDREDVDALLRGLE